jgi:hypothetical protein
MSGQIVIMVFEVVGSGICVSSDDGQKVHDQIAAALREGKKMKVSFLNVESLTSAFLNSAVGQLYGEFSEETIRASLAVAEMEQEDLALLKRVVETAKEYFRDPERFKKAQEDALEENDAD